MKKIFKLLAFSFVLIFNSCESENLVRLMNSFPFEARADFDSETFVNIPIDVIVDLQPERIVPIIVYTVSYRVIEGKANLNLDTETKEKLVQGESYVVEDLRFKTTITPISAGAIKVELTFSDQDGETTVKMIEFNSTDTNFTFNATRALANLIVGERLQISYDIEEQGTTSIDEYTLVFSGSKNGFLTVNSQDYLAGEKIKIPSLNFIAYYTPSVAGEHTITNTVTASSNKLTKTVDVSVDVEGSIFEFNVTAPIEVTIGKTINIDFSLDEIIGDSDFDLSYAVTGVNGEFRDANNVVLQKDTNYDVNNTFSWTLKGVQQGSMNIIFTATNQFGVEVKKTVPIEAVPVDFDFNVEIVGSIFNLGSKIPFQIIMDAPSSLSYELKFNANTDGEISILDEDTNEDVFTNINNTNFTLKYEPSKSGNAVVNFTIRASNGVEKTKSVNFQITENPEITSIEIDSRFHSPSDNTPMPFPRANCVVSGPNRERSFKILLRWKKAPSTSIVSISLRINGENRVGLFSPTLSENSSEATYIYTECLNRLGDVAIEATITDSRGEISEVFQKIL